MSNPNKNKKYELQNIDDFVDEFNNPEHNLGKLERISDDSQENPDAILELNGKVKIALEATLIFAPGYRPNETPPEETAYNPHPAIDEVLKTIARKSLNDYRGEEIDEVWLLISAGAYVSDHDLEERLSEITFNTFDRVFIHKGIHPDLIEILMKIDS